MATSHRKLDLPLSKLDDWDLLQAAFEAMIEEAGAHPSIDVARILETEFPQTQSKPAQEAKLKRMLSQRNEWGHTKHPLQQATPAETLADALHRILNETRLSQCKTIRQLLSPYLDTSEPISPDNSPITRRCPWTGHFRRDFWEYLAQEKINGAAWLTTNQEVKKRSLQPGELRTLNALKQINPEGATVRELAPLTRKDACSEETPRGSIDAWLKQLETEGLIKANQKRPKQWFFVKDYES